MSDDCISRQVVLDILKREGRKWGNDYRDWADAIEEIKNLPSVTPQPKTGHCKDCKWWKDSDGVYRRGVHAESQCPINRREVFEGNGYCYMYEPQETETWNGYHGQITAPKGTFKKIYEDAESEDKK